MSHAQLDGQLRSIGLSAAEITGFKEMLNAAVAHRRQHWEKKEPEDQEVWVLEMAELVHECGLARVYAGMRKAWTWNSFLPSASEVRECLPPVPDVAKPRAMHDPNCADCSGSGWKYVMSYSDLYQREECRAIRCNCNIHPHTTRKPDSAADVAFIAAKVAELNTVLKMDRLSPYARKPAPCATPVIPIVQFTADQIQRRKPVERAEIHDVEDKLIQARNGTYEPGPRS
jgi:hypothetical protein